MRNLNLSTSAEGYLKRHIFFEDLDKMAYAESDMEFAIQMQKEKEKIFQKLKFQKSL